MDIIAYKRIHSNPIQQFEHWLLSAISVMRGGVGLLFKERE